MKISEILKSEENIGAMIAFQLSLYSSFFWILTAIVFFSGSAFMIVLSSHFCIRPSGYPQS